MPAPHSARPTALQLATTAALPVLALPAILGGATVNHSLAAAAYLGVALFVLLLAAGAAVLKTDRPLELAGNATEWLLDATIRRKNRESGVARLASRRA